MKRIIAKSLLYIVLVTSLAFVLGLAFSEVALRRNFAPGSTHSVMLVLKEPQNYDLVILGSSHARITLDKINHGIYEERLNKSIANISYDGSGIVPIGVMSEYFFKEKYTCQNALYFIDAFTFFSDYYNENNRFLNKEPFNPKLFFIAIKWGITPSMLSSYYQSKYRTVWLLKEPEKLDKITTELTSVDTQKVRMRLENMYPDGLDNELANFYAKRLREVIKLYKQNSCDLFFVIPPTLLGTLPGEDYLIALLEKIKREEGIAYIDLSQAITDPSLYKDHDHLNTKGSILFLEEYVKPLVDSIYAKTTL